MRDRRAVARYAGLTGAPDESGAKRREQGLAKAGNARVRRGMIPLAWRFLRFQKDSALVRWYQARTADHRTGTRKTMIVALARKLLIALWRFVTRLAAQRDSVIADNVNAHGWVLLIDPATVPPVTPLTLSLPVKATAFRIIPWRCSARFEHRIARPRTRDLRWRIFFSKAAKKGTICGRAGVSWRCLDARSWLCAAGSGRRRQRRGRWPKWSP